MRKLLVILAIVAFTGCASTPPVTYIPVEVPCRAVEPPKPPLSYLPPYPDIFAAVKALIGDREATLGYVGELEAALKSCK